MAAGQWYGESDLRKLRLASQVGDLVDRTHTVPIQYCVFLSTEGDDLHHDQHRE